MCLVRSCLGFIPKSRSHFACTYSEMCHRALTEYYQEQQKKHQQQSAKLPVIANYTSQQFEVMSFELKCSLLLYTNAHMLTRHL